MTVQELYDWCKACKHKDAEVYLCKDWEEIDEDGCLTDLYELEDITEQSVIVDDGLDFTDIDEVILCFSNNRAGA